MTGDSVVAATLEQTAQLAWVPILLYHRVVPVLPPVDPFGNCTSTGLPLVS